MKSRYHKFRLSIILNISVIFFAIYAVFFFDYIEYASEGANCYTIYFDGVSVGVTNDADRVTDYYREAKRQLSMENGEMVFTEYPEITLVGAETVFGKTDSEQVIIDNIKASLSANSVTTLDHAYSVKVNGVVVNVRTVEEAEQLLQNAVNTYAPEGNFDVAIVKDNTRELNVLTASINRVEKDTIYEEPLKTAGAEVVFEVDEEDLLTEEIGFSSFDLGVKTISFSEEIEIVESYIPSSSIIDLAEAENRLLEEQEIQQIYKVQSGDTLSEISLTVGLPLDDIIALNPELENENSYIYVDQELIITVPEPELSVVWTEERKLEEAYDLPIEYVYNDDWYTNQTETLQQPSAGYHEAVVSITHSNESEIGRNVLYEEVIMQPVAKIVEIGTIIPPTYIKPLAGGRLSSRFGPRSAPVAGASTYHKGVDWATPIGTPIYASSSGTVVRAGWGSGYGYVVYINHPDGRQTRYGHLSKIYVSVGEYVTQGEVIAASGNTGRSSGPHVHFEILINGVQVNPFDYMY